MKRFIIPTLFAVIALPLAAQNKPAGANIDLKESRPLDDGSVKITPAPAPAVNLPATPEVKKIKAKEEPDPTLEILKNLKPEQVEKVRRNVNEASQFVAGIRLQEALQKLSEAEQIAPNLFMVHNLKGAVYTKMRSFDKARECFKRAMELNPKSFHPRFNLAEIEFVEHHWAKAQQDLEALLKEEIDEGTRKLIQFKLVICFLKQDKIADAEKLAATFSYIDDAPVYYLSKAALEFHKGNKSEAQSWIDSANRIYSQQVVSIYIDSFIEVGWVESLAL
ncbi:MAG: tetratricopeptide repeat protein [Verrucomicrobiales bacterium]